MRIGCQLIGHPAVGAECALIVLNEIVGKFASELIERAANVHSGCEIRQPLPRAIHGPGQPPLRFFLDGQPQQRFVDACTVNVRRRRIAADAAVPLGVDGVAVVEIAGGGTRAGLADPSAAVVVNVALSYRAGSGSRRRLQMIECVPHQRQRGGPGAGCSAVGGGPGDGTALAQLDHVPVGIMHRRADESTGVRSASDFAQLVRGIVQIRRRCSGFRFRAAVAVDVVTVGFGGAVVRFGQAVEVVVEIAPGLGAGVDGFGLASASALLVEAVEVAGENRRVVEVLFLLQAAVLEPGLRGALARVQALLDQAAAGVVGEGDGFVVGGGNAGQSSGGVVAQLAGGRRCLRPSLRIVKDLVVGYAASRLAHAMRASRNNLLQKLLRFPAVNLGCHPRLAHRYQCPIYMTSNHHQSLQYPNRVL